ncbi:MAG: hypothetical protein DWQ01_18570 [Planctomycetota bacterium]|nr:MAG: hypothetical protein DWQ01_18570 [Planctomycetota bacterium]
MSQAPAPKIKPRRRLSRKRRFRRWLAGCLLVLVGLYLSRTWTLAPWIRPLALSQLQKALGGEFECQGPSGSWFGSLELTRIRTRKAGTETPLRRLEADRVRLEYSLWDLLRGDPNWLQEIQAEQIHLVLDLRQGRPTEEAPSSSPPPRLPAHFPRLALQQIHLEILSEDFHLDLPNLNLATPEADPAPTQATLRQLGGSLQVADQRWPMSWRGELGFQDQRLEIPALYWQEDLFLADLQLDLGTWVKNRLLGRGSLSLPQAAWEPWRPEDVNFPEPKAVELQFEAELALEDLLASQAELHCRSEIPASGDFPAGDLQGRFRLAEGVVRIPDLSLNTAEGNLRIEELALPIERWDPENPANGWQGRLSVQWKDLQNLAKAAGWDGGGGRLALHLEAADGQWKFLEGRWEHESTILTFADAFVRPQVWTEPESRLQIHLPVHWQVNQAGALGLPQDFPGFQVQSLADLHLAWGKEGLRAEIELNRLEANTLQDPAWTLALESPSRLRYGTDGFEISPLTLHTLEGKLHLQGKSDPWPRDRNQAGQSRLHLEGLAEDLNLQTLAPLLPGGQDWTAAPLHARFQVQGNWLQPEVQFSGETRGWNLPRPWDPQQSAVDLVWDLTYRSESWHLHHFQSQSPAWHIAARGQWQTALDLFALGQGEPWAHGPLQAEAEVDLQDLAWWSDIAAWPGSVEGNLQAQVQVEGPLQQLQWQASAVLEEAAWTPPEASPEEPSTPESWRGSGVRLTSTGAMDEGQWSGKVIFEQGQFTHGDWQTSFREPGLVQKFSDQRLAVDFPSVTVSDTDWALRALATSEKLAIETLQGNGEGLQLDFTATIPLDAEQEMPALASAPMQADLEIQQLDLQRLNQWLPIPGPWQDWKGQVQGRLKADGSTQNPALSMQLEAEALQAPSALDLPFEDTFQLQTSWTYEQGTWQLDQGRLENDSLSLEAEPCRLQLPLDLIELSKGTPLEWRQSALAGAFVFSSEDLSWLGHEEGTLRRAGGRLHARLELAGTAGDPELAGDLEIQDGELRLASPGLASFTALQGKAKLHGNRLDLDALHGELGASPFQAKGWIDFNERSNPSLQIALRGEDLLLYRRQGVKLRADSELLVQGTLQDLWLKGKLDVTDGRFVKNIDLLALTESRPTTPGGPEGINLFSLGPPLDQMKIDLSVVSENGFRIKNNLINGMVRPDLKILGTGEVPYMQGRLYVDPTLVSLPATTLRIQSGWIQFEEGDPFIPKLQLAGETRQLGYDVKMSLTGPYHEPLIRFSSVPPLAQDQLLLMVMTGKPPEDPFNRNAGNRALGSVAVYLGRDFLTRLFGDESTESRESLLNRFEVETGRDATRSGAETVEGRFLLVRNVLVEGDALYIEGEKDAYDDFNLGIKLLFRLQ